MESLHFSAAAPATAGTRATITRTAEDRWRAVEDGREVGRGEATRLPDGRTSISIDTWHGVVFDQLAAAMTGDLTGPLRTLVDDTDLDLRARWERVGLTVRRREELVRLATADAATHTDTAAHADTAPHTDSAHTDSAAATDPAGTGAVGSGAVGSGAASTGAVGTGLGAAPQPGVTILGLGEASGPALRALFDALRAEIEADPGWDAMPVAMPPRPASGPLDPDRYAVAVVDGAYGGLVEVVSRRTHARIGLVAVREGLRRRGLARALLTTALVTLHQRGIATASADLDARAGAAAALFRSLGARRVNGVVELGRGA